MKKKNAFTLAEVLITLGIIGIVAAMTLPAIIYKQNDKEAVTRLKKMYSTLENAYNVAIVENGSPDTWSNNPADTPNVFANILEPYLKIVGKHSNKVQVKFLSYKEQTSYNEYPKKVFKLADGSEYVFVSLYSTSESSAKCSGNMNGKSLNECIWVLADINGVEKQPNRIGEDMFYFILTKSKVYPVGVVGYWGANTCRPDKSSDQGTGYGCTAYVLLHENRDYLKCKTGKEAICGKIKY